MPISPELERRWHQILSLVSRHMVEKKAMLRVSRGLSWVHSGERVCGSDSPVSEELSTLHPWAWRIRMSAGTRSPPFISTRSPTTS